MSVATGLNPGTTSYQVISEVLEEWRQETIPERDNLYGGTRGDNEAHLVVRAAFLDLLFRDEKVNTFIQDLVNAAPRYEYLQQLERVLGQPDLVLDLETGPGGRCFGPGHDSQDLFGLSRLITGKTSNQSPTVLPNSRKSLDSSQDTPSLVVDIGDFISHLGFPYPWLLLEFLAVYIARLFIDGYTWTYRGNLEVEDADKTAILPREKFIFEVSPLETVSAGVARLRSEVEEFETRITRFLDVLPAGKIPVKRISSLEEYTTWLYRNKIRGESIKSISKKVFPGEDDRRKDIYDGIERASHLLTLGA